MQEIIQMCNFEGTKSTKGASKLRRDLINAEIGQLRELLPLPPSTRQRLSQLQLMALVCVYIRKSNYFQQVFKHRDPPHHPTPNIGFSKALSGFIMMMTQGGKLLFISDNAAEYLGHSMEDLLIHGDSVFDIIDKQDHTAVQSELARGAQASTPQDEDRLFICRMNVSRNARRQMRFGDQKVVLVQGHFLSYLPLCSRNEPVFLAHCTPVAMPETRECVVQGATNVFTSVHTLDMKFISLDKNGEFYLGYNKSNLSGVSWYHLIHPDHIREAQTKHRLITSSEQDRSCILLLRLQSAGGSWRWVHCVLQVKDSNDTTTPSQPQPVTPQQTSTAGQSTPTTPTTPPQTSQTQQQPVIVATNQVLGDKEAAVLRNNSWLYHYYTMQSKLQYGLTYEAHAQRVHAYYPPVMSYQPETAAPYMAPSSLNTPHTHAHTPSHAAHSAYPLTPTTPYAAHLQHYHHHYSVRLQHGLDYTRDAAAWGYYDTSTPYTAQTPQTTPEHNTPSSMQTSPSSASIQRPNNRKSPPSPKSISPRRSPKTSISGGQSLSDGGSVAVATPVAVRATPLIQQKLCTTDMEDSDSSWKSSPSQEVPDYYEYTPFITPPYSATTPTKASIFTFETSSEARDQRVPSVESVENSWATELATRVPWLSADELSAPLRALHHTT